MSCSRAAYASASGLSIGTLITSSVYGGRLAKMSSSETNAPISMRNLPNSSGDAPGRSLTRLVIRFVTIVCIPKEETAPFGRVQPMCSLLSEPVGRVSECVTRHCKHDSMSERGGLRLRLTPPQATARYHCLKQCSRCHLKKCGCGRSDMRRGASARPDLLIIDRTACGSFVCREINISKSSAKLISPRSNIQCAVPESAIPLLIISGPLASTERMCAAATSARPRPLMNFRPVMAQRSS